MSDLAGVYRRNYAKYIAYKTPNGGEIILVAQDLTIHQSHQKYLAKQEPSTQDKADLQKFNLKDGFSQLLLEPT